MEITIDRWQRLCDGDVSELVEYVSMQPQNRVKVILGVQTNDDNKSYQVFIHDKFIGNGAVPNAQTGEYVTAQKAIDKFYEEQQKSSERNPSYVPPAISFSAAPVKEWKVSATEVADASESQGSPYDDFPEDDLPFKD